MQGYTAVIIFQYTMKVISKLSDRKVTTCQFQNDNNASTDNIIYGFPRLLKLSNTFSRIFYRILRISLHKNSNTHLLIVSHPYPR